MNMMNLKSKILMGGNMELQITKHTTSISSVEVAEMIGKQHNALLKSIRQYIEYLAEGEIDQGDYFKESTYEDANNQKRPCYNVTKLGCEMIANKITGSKGTQFTALYVKRFNQMERTLFSGLSPEMQGLILHDKKIIQHDERIKNLEDTKFINPKQKKEIISYVKKLVLKACGEKTPAYKKFSRKVFSECYRYLFDEIGVSQVAETPYIEFDHAMEHLSTWYPRPETKKEIDRLNNEEQEDVG